MYRAVVTGGRDNDSAGVERAALEGPQGPKAQQPLAGHRLIALTLAVVSLVVIVHSVTGLGLWRRSQPGAGLFPFVLAVGLLIASARLAWLRPPIPSPHEPVGGNLGKVLKALAVYVAFPLLLPLAGYVACSAAFVMVWLLVVERQSLARAALGGAVGGLAVWLIFGVGLDVPLPSGLLIGR